MSTEKRRNAGHSVFERLRNEARGRGTDFTFELQRYANERLLYRLGVSQHRENFILKGASLFLVWLGKNYRATRDVDLLAFGSSDIDHIRTVFQEFCQMETEEPDGIVFNPDSVAVEPIREQQAYGGQRVTLTARLHSARITLQVDLGFGDAVTPEPEEIEYPARLEFPAPKLLAYPKATLVAEKLEAMVSLGIANSRLKDFYDVWLLSRKAIFDGKVLQDAIRATFERRRTALPREAPTAFTAEFAKDLQNQAQWQAFIARHEAEEAPASLAAVIDVIKGFLQPVLTSLASATGHPGTWNPGGGWS